MSATIYLHGNLLRVRSTLPSVFAHLRKELRYQKKIYNATALQRRAAGGAAITFQYVDCYEMVTVDGEQQLVAPAGFYSRISKVISKLSVPCVTKRIDDLLTRKNFTQNWEVVSDFDWRYKQRETLQTVVNSDRGQVKHATGTGKSWLMVPLCMLMSKARIVITTKHLQVLQEHYTRIAKHIGDVGIICSGKNIAGRRVMCVSSGSLHRVDPKNVDIVIVDEHHELGTDAYISKLAAFTNSRMYAFSANVGDRTDCSDFELEGMFGTVLTEMTYEEGVANSMVVPIEVEWHSVKLDYNPASGCEGIIRKRNGLWRNTERNRLIAQVAQNYEEEQVLITVETVEHACQLKRLLPEFSLCYSVSPESSQTVQNAYSSGVLQNPEPPMTPERMFNLKRDFELGLNKKVIATSVWNRGVNFHQLQVLIRADGASSAVADTQIPGRLSRLSEGKTHGKLVDFLDEFDDALNRSAKRRMHDYKQKGWLQKKPDGTELFSTTGKNANAGTAGLQTDNRRRRRRAQS